MRKVVKQGVFALLPIADILMVPFLLPVGYALRFVRRLGIQRFPLTRKVLRLVGVFPIRKHYYEPLFDYDEISQPLDKPRALPGISWDETKQIEVLSSLVFAEEIRNLPQEQSHELEFALGNYSFGPGDADIWYQVIRRYKPRRIIEIGSGHSTLLARQAIQKNRDEDPAFECQHTCIEPYEMPWLEKTKIQVIRKKVEELDTSAFSDLENGDVLFIDSSHMIRPNGDVLYEFLEILPSLKPGVIVHIHDIFTPANYPAEWLKNEVRFWNEQYLLEAFLTENPHWEILIPVNYLYKNHFEKLKLAAPSISANCDPASFYIRKKTDGIGKGR